MPFVYIAAALLSILVITWLANTYIPMPPAIKAVLNVVLGLIVVGMVLWLINTYIPMAGGIKALVNIVVFIASCVAVLQVLGLWDSTLRLWANFKNHRLSH